MATVRQVHRMTPTWSSTLKGQIPNIHVTSYSYQVPNFTLIRPTGTRFRVTGHFETTGPSDPKRVWTVKGQRCPIYMLQVSTSPICHSYYSTAGHLWVTGHFETCASNNPQMTLNFKRSKARYICMYTIYVTTTPESEIHSASFCSQPFLSYRPFWLKMVCNSKMAGYRNFWDMKCAE